ncbi:MAG TPA: Plug domain-containing protein, partial [Gammaproteobacteria bacterium]|nr:Plug domain-containing protein [Gammaproteobacteria bacterium]
MPLLGLAGAAAQAQQPADQGNAAQAPASLEEITVTGSRIRRTSDFDTPNPTTVVDDSYMRNLGIVNVGDAVQQLPVNVSNNTPTTTGNANFFTGSTIANLRGLNPFFGSRTLTLVDNRRFVPTNQGDGVDLNFIPSVLISRIDSVTGGASAAYGSGAISGVQNIFLNRTLEGGRIDIDGYQTNQSDALDRHIGAAYGHAFADDKAHLVVGYEAQNSDSVDCLERDWCQRSEAFIPGGVGMPTQVHEADVHANQISPSGVFNSLVPGAATALQVNEAGTGFGQPFRIGQGFPTAPAVPGGPPGNTATSPFNNVVGGDGIPIYQFTNLRAPVDRRIATGLFTYDFNDKLTMNVDVSYGRVKSTNITQALTDRFQFIEPDNAFLTPELAAGVGSFGAPIGLAGSFFNKDWTPQVDSHTTVDTKVKRGVVGFEGQFGESSWTWQGYYQYGKTDREQFVADNRHNAAYAMAVDSVIDPATG